MSVKPLRLLAALLCLALPVRALGLPAVPDLIRDPLSANPEILNQAASLACGAAFDALAPLALADAVDQALCHNPQVKFAWADIKAQAGAVGEARSAYLPTLNLTLNRLATTTTYPDAHDADSVSRGTTQYANLSWRLFNFGAREANLESANQLLSAAMASHQATLQKVLAALIGAYFDAITADAVYLARADSSILAQGTLQASRRREAGGAGAISDVLQAQTALAKAQLAQERARGDQRKTHAMLAYMMGLPADTGLRLPDAVTPATGQQVHAIKEWLEQAQTRHPAIVAARAQVKAAKAKVNAVRAEGLGSLDFTYSYYKNGYPNQGLSAGQTKVSTYGLAFNIPIFEGFSRTYKIRGAQAHTEQSEARLHDTLLQISTEVVKTYADAQSSLENLSASQMLLEAAHAALKSSERRYAKGAADILELLSTQNALADARQERIRCLAEWQAARLKLVAAVGILDRVTLVP